MELTVNLTVPEDFISLCTIYNIQPQIIIQSFADNVSFPSFYTKADTKDRWATYFFLHYIQTRDEDDELADELRDHYLQRFTDALTDNIDQHNDDGETAREAGRNVMRQWQKAVLAERAKYIFDGL